MKIIYSYRGHHTERKINEYLKAGYNITLINHGDELGEDKLYRPNELYKKYRRKCPKLMQLYKKITELSKTHDIFMVNDDNVYVPEFLKSLKNIHKVYFCSDDPDSSDIRSKPYVHSFDYCFTASVNFDRNTRVTKKYLEWGAKRASWCPIGAISTDFDPTLSIKDIYNKNRDIDLIYVGVADPLKVSRLLELKKRLKKDVDFKLYGGGWEFFTSAGRYWSLAYLLFKHFRWARNTYPFSRFFKQIENATYLPDNELVPIYQRTKIGVNVHISYGPINRRLYALPANGVMQICDCPEGLDQVFRVGKEVIVFHSIKEAAELIRYYLKHDDERKKIAVAGFKKVMKDYTNLKIFSAIIKKIKRAKLEDKINFFKDGSPILGNENEVQ